MELYNDFEASIMYWDYYDGHLPGRVLGLEIPKGLHGQWDGILAL
jgi:hypothetical protein